jgi:hypothetical protein
MKPVVALSLLITLTYTVNARQITLAEKLGYSPDAKLLIVHADDVPGFLKWLNLR